MKLVAGLGNPGEEYEGTPHNVGFRVIDILAENFGISEFKKNFESHVYIFCNFQICLKQ